MADVPMVADDDPRVTPGLAALAQHLGLSLSYLTDMTRMSVRVILAAADDRAGAVAAARELPYTRGLLLRLALHNACATSEAETALAELEARL